MPRSPMRIDRARARRRMLASAVVIGTVGGIAATGAGAATLLSDDFDAYPNGLITSEFSYWHPDSPFARPTEKWQVTSGALFSAPDGDGNAGYSGVPTDVTGPSSPAPTETADNNSATFRMTSKASGFGDATVSFRLLVQGLSSTAGTPVHAWDGVHVFLRHQSEESLYYASVDRRDGALAIKKKVPGGPTNGGTYFTLASTKRGTAPIPFATWQAIAVGIHTNPDGSVTITISRDGAPALTVTDDGTVGGPPILAPGRTGIRGDNAEFYVDDFLVDGPDVTAPVVQVVSPGDQALVGRRETVQATAADDVGVQSMTLRVDGAPVATSSGGQLMSDVRFWRGSHTLEVVAVDTSGNASVRTIHVTRQ